MGTDLPNLPEIPEVALVKTVMANRKRTSRGIASWANWIDILEWNQCDKNKGSKKYTGAAIAYFNSGAV